MLHTRWRRRATHAAAALGATLVCGLAAATVVSRDLPKQLELIKAQSGGIAVYGKIVRESAVVNWPDQCPVPMTALQVQILQAAAPADVKGEITVYVPGHGEDKLSVTPPEAETRVGESVFMFLAANEGLRSHDPNAYSAATFADIYRTQLNKRGEVIVIGEGVGVAIPENVALTKLVGQVKTAYDALIAAEAPKSKQKKN